MTVLVKLIACEEDSFGYITYVFKRLEESSEYIMCVRFPNWNHKKIKLGDIGYLSYEEIRAGIDKWYDGEGMIPYKYNTIQFIKFMDVPDDSTQEYIM